MPNLLQLILEKTKSRSKSDLRVYGCSLTSPPPELVKVEQALYRKKKKYVDKWKHIKAKVDTSPPPYSPYQRVYKLQSWYSQYKRIFADNVQLVTDMKRQHFTRGKVDSRWKHTPKLIKSYYYNRVSFLKNVNRRNMEIYEMIKSAQPKVATTASLRRDWEYNRAHIIQQAEGKFILFPPIMQEEIEDLAFRCPKGVKRPRVYMSIRIKDHAPFGTLVIELFTDVCPKTCKLFLDLFDGDGVGYGYVGTKFFRKVPGLYWRGGDVVYDNGFGCYAQKGRLVPIGAENFHFPHSMTGLLSMSVTKDNEMCGIFNIMFKPLLQFDLHHVVFGRVIRPSAVFNTITHLGSSLSTYPELQIMSTKRKVHDSWVNGKPNTNILSQRPALKNGNKHMRMYLFYYLTIYNYVARHFLLIHGHH